jgi:hypothetical protein
MTWQMRREREQSERITREFAHTRPQTAPTERQPIQLLYAKPRLVPTARHNHDEAVASAAGASRDKGRSYTFGSGSRRAVPAWTRGVAFF